MDGVVVSYGALGRKHFVFKCQVPNGEEYRIF